MTNTQKDPLFVLIKSLTKSEKRQFKLYVGRLDVNVDSKFILLFHLMEKSKSYNEDEIIKSGIVAKTQISNLKAHLYKQILISLRLNPAHHNIRIQLREQLDFATILYHKGLYRQSLKILEKAKNTAIAHQEKSIAHEIVELEKVIETQYFAKSTSDRVLSLVTQTQELVAQNTVASQWSNLSLQLYAMMLQVGYARTAQEQERVRSFFELNAPDDHMEERGIREKLWYYKAHLWYHFLLQDFLTCYKYAHKWVQLFDEHPEMIQFHPVFYLKGNNYLMESLFYLRYRSLFERTLEQLEFKTKLAEFPHNENISSLAFLYLSSHRMNLHFMKGSFSQGLERVPQIEAGISLHKDRLDKHHVMVLYYKIACMYFGSGDYKKSIEYLKKIIANKDLHMREDLMCFSRLLSLIAHYEAGMDYHLEIQLKATYKFLLRMNDLQQVQKEMMRFMKRLGSIFPQDLPQAFQELYDRLLVFEHHPIEKRAFLYLDVLSWLESHLQKRPFAEVIVEKAKNDR